MIFTWLPNDPWKKVHKCDELFQITGSDEEDDESSSDESDLSESDDESESEIGMYDLDVCPSGCDQVRKCFFLITYWLSRRL